MNLPQLVTKDSCINPELVWILGRPIDFRVPVVPEQHPQAKERQARILTLLNDGCRTVQDIRKHTDWAISGIRKHLQAMADDGILTLEEKKINGHVLHIWHIR